ncbi:hypothetical protein UFOVP756_19 [uncultured Caudovirales phage]|uniref:Uncharacterized protein n=1 Tax=uncultured Caudovirales phage TaxID=2100421 RepID=A0A6J7X4Z0_9CAUD|nr:hypothetical protein UFOVP756_19 [uncultured Caudovirales phage]
MIHKIINWSQLSRYLTNGDRKTLLPSKIPRKHWAKMDKLIHYELPQWWENFKTKNS